MLDLFIIVVEEKFVLKMGGLFLVFADSSTDGDSYCIYSRADFLPMFVCCAVPGGS